MKKVFLVLSCSLGLVLMGCSGSSNNESSNEEVQDTITAESSVSENDAEVSETSVDDADVDDAMEAAKMASELNESLADASDDEDLKQAA